MRKPLKWCGIILWAASAAAAFDFYSYWEPPLVGAAASVAVADDARSVPLNAAGLAAGHGFNAFFSSAVQDLGARDLHLYGDTLIGGFGYDWAREDHPDVRASRFSWTCGFPVYRWVGAGVGVGRLAASHPYLTAAWTVDAGLLVRPMPYASFGLSARNLNEPRFLRRVEPRTYVLGVGVRPGWERLTLAGDVGWREGDPTDEVGWRVGADVEVVSGVTLGADVDDEKRIGMAVSAGFPNFGAGYVARVNEDADLVGDNLSFYANTERRRSVVVGGKRYAEITVSGNLQEGEPGFSLFGSGTSARDIIRKLDAAADDPAIAGVIVRVGGVGMSGLAQEIKAALARVRARGKKVYAYVDDVMDPGAYYVAAGADCVAMSPRGYFAGTGGYMSLWRIKDLAARFGVEFEYATAGTYKGSSAEVFAGPPTEQQLEETQAIVDDIYARFVRDVAADRGLSEEVFRKYYEGPLLDAAACKDAGLVDEVTRYEGLKDFIARADRVDEIAASPAGAGRAWEYRWGRPRKVRVILAEGFILRGESGRIFLFGPRSMGSDTLVDQIKAAREDPEVGAVVLRVNSGGGDGLASDDIYQELKKCRDSGKVVVASMGDVAASGGYMISCAGERIFAEPATITASIGVFSQKLVLEDLYEKYGIDQYIIKPHEHADAMSPRRHLTTEEMAWMEDATRKAYDDFVATVAEARGMDRARVAEIAEGRVYTGAVAKDLGLVDEMGGLAEAVAYARGKAGLPSYSPVEYVGWEDAFVSRMMRAAGVVAGW